jgi:hypothetical protein
MTEAGLFGEDDRLELIEGEVLEMGPIGSRHAGCVARLQNRLERSLGATAIVWLQSPIRLGERSRTPRWHTIGA